MEDKFTKYAIMFGDAIVIAGKIIVLAAFLAGFVFAGAMSVYGGL